MVYVIDLIVVGIILLVTLISAKQGFVRTVLDVVGFVAAVVIAFTASQPLADITYDKFIEPSIVNSIEETVSSSTNDTVDNLWENIPSFITENGKDFGLSKESIKDMLSTGTQGDANATVISMSQNTIKPVCTGIIGTVFAVILMIVLLIIVRILAKLLNKVFSFSVVGKINTTLGGVLGVIKGLVIALLVCEIIVLIISFTDNGIWIFNNENINKTVVFKFLTNVF